MQLCLSKENNGQSLEMASSSNKYLNIYNTISSFWDLWASYFWKKMLPLVFGHFVNIAIFKNWTLFWIFNSKSEAVLD